MQVHVAMAFFWLLGVSGMECLMVDMANAGQNAGMGHSLPNVLRNTWLPTLSFRYAGGDAGWGQGPG